MTTVPWGAHDRRIARSATGLLATFNQVGVLEAADVHVAARLGALADEHDDVVLLAVALTVRATRMGAVCVDLGRVAEQPVDGETELPWPHPEDWAQRVAASPLVSGIVDPQQPDRRPGVVLRLETTADGRLLYLDRHWREETQVLDDLLVRLAQRPPEVDDARRDASLTRLFSGQTWAEQRAAARRATGQWTTILTGGPGTGKTASVARMLVLLAEQFEATHERPPRIALAAPTGKASARLGESVAREAGALEAQRDRDRLAGLGASTLHRLLGWRPDSGTRFRHHRSNPLPYDVVVVDEVSMVSLSQMARLLEALRPGTRLVLVGDADQLASVEAGAVLRDLVEGFATLGEDSPVVKLETNHRILEQADATADEPHPLDLLAQLLRRGDAERVVALLTSGDALVRLVDPQDPAQEAAMSAVLGTIGDAASAVLARALEFRDGDAPGLFAELDRHRLLCAHRQGPFGVGGWNREVERLLTERDQIPPYEEWYAGRQVMVTANDRGLGISNGDIGVVVRLPDGRLRVALRVDNQVRLIAPTRLSAIETVFAMTVHKSQGSEANAVTVVLPQDESRLLTRELLYTAVTRAREQVTVVGSVESLTAAIGLRVQRASGLRDRIAGALSARSG